ncbi:MAG: excinuclease ABC subunit UvrC [Crocinitomicaceae bacterium]|nr:excinuclease ABC subunit UvrC [Crocinitomicaceae bacterium]
MTPPDLKPIVNSLPEKPGVYKYFDKEGVIIYVGKAKSLKKRVSSYFTKKHHDNFKTSVLVSKIVHLEYTVVDTEMDALLLENSLIKEFQPKYNIALKDDKSYPYIKVTKERFPRVFSMFNPVRDGSEYFGPYANKKVMYTVLELIKKLYPVRNCTYNLSQANIDAFKFKVCLEYQIGNCKGPCEAYQTEDSYNEGIRQIRHILKGNLHEVKEHLKMLMMDASRRLAFEEAQEYKDKLDSLVSYQSRSTVVSPVLGDLEVYSTSSTDKISFVNFLRVSHGIIVISRNVEIRKKMDETDEEILVHVMGEMRKHYGDDVKEIVLPMQLDWPDDRITITVPKAGDKKKLIDLSLKNAMLYKHEKLTQYEKLNPSVRVDRLLEQMKNDLHLKDLPRHIECFDNSNFQGTYPVSACVVFKDGKPSKNDYRHFNVKTVEGPDDFETMKEVITRRYSRLRDENQPLPQLIVVDGGKGQLSHAVEALKALGLYGQMAIVGIAKRLEEIYYPDDSVPLYIDKKSETLKVIQHMRDEAHRFGITHHRSRRDKGTLKTSLTEIPGIGPEKARQLLKEFKSITRIKDSSIETLIPVIGKAKAELVYQYFHGEES